MHNKKSLPDYYSVLGLADDASGIEIKNQYRKLAKQNSFALKNKKYCNLLTLKIVSKKKEKDDLLIYKSSFNHHLCKQGFPPKRRIASCITPKKRPMEISRKKM